MRSDTASTPITSPAPGVIPDATTRTVSDLPPMAALNTARARDAAAAADGTETRAEHFSRKALRARLNGYAIATVALVAVLIALAASNTAHVKVNWLIGNSQVSLVWLVLVAAIVGWLLGLLASARFHWRTRTPRRSGVRS
ncbi:MAG: LapA family protein [Actinomycetota bacterium]|nr:LapA family protein [Actinomycetota bacterium]